MVPECRLITQRFFRPIHNLGAKNVLLAGGEQVE